MGEECPGNEDEGTGNEMWPSKHVKTPTFPSVNAQLPIAKGQSVNCGALKLKQSGLYFLMMRLYDNIEKRTRPPASSANFSPGHNIL